MVQAVEGTPFDFRHGNVIGSRINDKNEQLTLGKGYDHNFVLDAPGNLTQWAVKVEEPNSGRVMEVYTTSLECSFTPEIFWMDRCREWAARLNTARRCVWRRSIFRIRRTIQIFPARCCDRGNVSQRDDLPVQNGGIEVLINSQKVSESLQKSRKVGSFASLLRPRVLSVTARRQILSPFVPALYLQFSRSAGAPPPKLVAQ